MKFRLSLGFAALAAAALAQPAAAQDRVFEGSDTSCTVEVRYDAKAMLMQVEADGTSQIGLMFKTAVDRPGRTREGYFSMRFDFSTAGPVTYRDGYDGEFAQGYIADMSVEDLLWMLSETQGRFAYSVGGTAHRIETETGEDIAEFAAFRGCVAKLTA